MTSYKSLASKLLKAFSCSVLILLFCKLRSWERDTSVKAPSTISVSSKPFKSNDLQANTKMKIRRSTNICKFAWFQKKRLTCGWIHGNLESQLSSADYPKTAHLACWFPGRHPSRWVISCCSINPCTIQQISVMINKKDMDCKESKFTNAVLAYCSPLRSRINYQISSSKQPTLSLKS